MFKYFVEDNLCEIPFLKEIEPFLMGKLNKNINVVDVRNLHNLPFIPHKDTVILLLSDEHFSIPKYINEVKCIFKTGVSKANVDLYKNLFPFPLGYTKKFVIKNNIKNIKERPIDVFFAGQVMTPDRAEMIQEITELKQNYPNLNVVHNISPTFLNGFTGDTYSDLMYNSKICLCPAGTTMPESFRYYEAFKANCTIFTKNYLPETSLYEKSPIIKMESWSQLSEAVNYFLSKENLMQNYFSNIQNYQEQNYSPMAIASYIINKVNEL